MYQDEIVEEVRRHREARAAKFNFNIRAIVEDARRRQKTSGHPVVDLSHERKRKPKPATRRRRSGSTAG